MLTTAWSNYVLSCRVKAALALAPSTAHLEVEAPCDHCLVELHGKLPWTVDLHEVERVIHKVPGVNEVRVDGLRPASSEGLSLPGMFPARTLSARPAHNLAGPWTARFAAASTLAIILTLAVNGITGSVVDRITGSWGAEKKVFVGYVTDTLCKHAAGMDPECIRSCVQRYPDVQYALSDGSNLYPLSDRSTPAIYAAQLVRVVGRFDKASGAIQIESIQPVPKDGAAYRAPVDVFGDKRTT